MCNLFRTLDGRQRRPSTQIPVQLADGRSIEGTWAGSAKEEKLDWWLRKPGNQLVQSEPVSAVALKADDNGELIWGEAPAGARLIFVLEAQPPGKSYRLAKLITTAASAAEIAYFRHDRFALFGTLEPEGGIRRIPSLVPPPPKGPAQGELF